MSIPLTPKMGHIPFMKTNLNTVAALAIVAVTTGITGCAAQADPQLSEQALTNEAASIPTAKAASAPYLDSIARLQALHVVEFRPLAERAAETGNCYAQDLATTSIGKICVQDIPAHAAELAAADKKLADFVVLAEKAVAEAAAIVAATEGLNPGYGLYPDTNLDALKSLKVFEVGSFIVDAPESYSCYGLCNPCNQTRAFELEAIRKAL